MSEKKNTETENSDLSGKNVAWSSNKQHSLLSCLKLVFANHGFLSFLLNVSFTFGILAHS